MDVQFQKPGTRKQETRIVKNLVKDEFACDQKVVGKMNFLKMSSTKNLLAEFK